MYILWKEILNISENEVKEVSNEFIFKHCVDEATVGDFLSRYQ